MKRFLIQAGNLILAIPHSYACTLFSDSVLLGLILLLVTFSSPIVGLSGMLGLLTALLFSRILGWESWESRSGVAAFNSLIISLALGYYYPGQMIAHSPFMYMGIICLTSIGTLLLYFVLSYLFNQWFRLPPMSLAFSIVAIIIWQYMARNGLLTNYPFDKLVLINWEPHLSEYWRLFFVSMGSVFFSPTVLAGVFVALALLVITRIGLGLALMGWTISYILMQAQGFSSNTGMFYPGFNGILIMLAIGGVFLLPGKTSLVIAAISTALGYLLIVLLSSLSYHFNSYTGLYTPLAIPVFAFPLNVVVLLVIFSLRLRLVSTKPVMNDFGVYNPERALQVYQERYYRFSTLGIPQFSLPITGAWQVTQGHNGDQTHKLDWAYAWDFEITDKEGKRFVELESTLGDYYSFGKPVLSSASGYIAKVMDGVPDNPIGAINTRENWGNYICISHGFGLYSFYAHLKNGSIKVKPGDFVNQGDRIGLVGNSGRSPLPHLHFQIQIGVEAGSKTRYSQFVNYKVHEKSGASMFIAQGVPSLGETISTLVPEAHLQTMMCLQNLAENSFLVSGKHSQWNESWKVGLDLYGRFTITSSRHSELEFSVYQGIFNALSLKGRRSNALSAFAQILSRLPYVNGGNVSWRDEPPYSLSLNPFIKEIVLILSLICKPMRVIVISSLEEHGKNITISSRINYRLLGINVGSLDGEVILEKNNMIVSIRICKNSQTILHAKGVKNAEV